MYLKVKRIGDFIFSLLGLISLSPILVLIALAIKLESRGSVFFKQKRFGIHKSHFFLWKFRSMKQDAPHDLPTHMFPREAEWETRVGKILRRTSLDELPQLFNIIRGDMSFVGPRPALWNQEDLVMERDRYQANDVPVGLTGWAQVNGREWLSTEEKAALDGEYARQIGFLFDLRCLARTLPALVTRRVESHA